MPLSVNGVSPDNTGNIQLELDWDNAQLIMWVGLAIASGMQPTYHTAPWTAPKNGRFISIPIGSTSQFQAWSSATAGLEAKINALFGRNITVNYLVGSEYAYCFNCLKTKVLWQGVPSEQDRFINIVRINGGSVALRLASNLRQSVSAISSAQGSMYTYAYDTYIFEPEVKAGATYQADISGQASGDEMLTCCVFVPYKE